jgi:S1-C subfamily serine protease
LTVPKAGVIGQWFEPELLLYFDADLAQPINPVWFVHPSFHDQVDVVAIPFTVPPGAQVFPVNSMNTVPDLRLIVSDEVFALGYPKGISGGGVFPIWKRASIATEPELDLNDLPVMLIDTATREGMSGGPVIAVKSGGYMTESGDQVLGSSGSRFVGVYSGRLGKDEMAAQLGVVWKAVLIEPIIRGKIKGQSSFC